MKGKFTLKAAVVIVLVFGFVVVYAIVVRREARRIAGTRVGSLLQAINPDHSEFREPYSWGPEDFFHASDVLHASEVIMTGDSDKLQELIDSGLDVNSTGKAGMTLLHWALAYRNLEAFQLLLDAGANPHKRLKYSLALPEKGQMLFGDSVLFSCLRQAKWPFLFAAIEKTGDVDQLDVNGDTLLIAALRQYGLGVENPALLSIDEEILQRLIDSGVNLDARSEYGYTAAWHALRSGRPLLCLMILEAGGDPDIACNDGETLGGALTGIIKRYEEQELVDRLAEARLLQQWLNVYHGKAVEHP
jgi:hypothetical protein